MTEEEKRRSLGWKVAIVTGASKGIGAAIAISLGKAGASVVVNYASSRDGVERTVEAIRSRGGNAIALSGDVSKASDVAKLFAEADAAYGTLDIKAIHFDGFSANRRLKADGTPCENLDTPANRPNLFKPQCDDGIDPGGAMRGYESGDQCKYS